MGAIHYYSWLLVIILLVASFSVQSQHAVPQTPPKKIYMVQMKHDSKPQHYSTHHDWYSDTLHSLTSTHDSLVYTYTIAFHGFSAHLHPHQADSLRKLPSVLDVFEDIIYTPQTTRTPHFLGLTSNFTFLDATKQRGTTNSSFFDVEEASNDVIIGVMDTGVWPESKSFRDEGMPEIPSRWKGKCESGPSFNPKKLCNKKLIGARYFYDSFLKETGLNKSVVRLSPRDDHGHGTHAATTAAGSRVANASLFGFARGTARGMAVNARVSSYKVCWFIYCFGADILKGIEWAISDGVDVISLSIANTTIVVPYYHDSVAIGAFAAVEKGIFVSCAAGNDGPMDATVVNVAPWITTVGAGTMDRDFPAFVSLGDNKQFKGVSIFSGIGMGNKLVELVYRKGSNKSSNLCLSGSLDRKLTRGKVVVCDYGVSMGAEKGLAVKEAGGVGMILLNPEAYGEWLGVESPLVQTVAVGNKLADYIREYARKDHNPTAILGFGKTVVNVRPSPMVAAFSSRGPNPVTPRILKPDVIAPGSNILAAWPEEIGPSDLDEDTRVTDFNILSGTSMACPHISGIAALLKAAHPKWSPSAIRSAIMTTAYTMDSTHSPLKDSATGDFSNPYAHGSGHVDLRKALSPGLIYDITTNDYVAFVCSLNYTITNVQKIIQRTDVTCQRKFSDPGQLNYPSFSVVFETGKRVVRYTRQVTNVGASRSSYDVVVKAPRAYVEVMVKPAKLIFKNVGEKKRYTVTFVSKKGAAPASGSAFGSVVWRNPRHQVSSPVAFTWASQ